MKKILIVSSLLLLISVAAMGQETRLTSAPKAFRTFFATFKSAVERSDKTAVAGMSKFPFNYAYDAGDEGTYSRSQFIRHFSDVFSKNPRRFFDERSPAFHIGDHDSVVIDTKDAAHLVFAKSGRTYKFSEYLVEP